MKKVIVLIVVVGTLAGLYMLNNKSTEIKPDTSENAEAPGFRPNPSNATFIFNDGPITLSRGRNERSIAPESLIKEETLLTEHVAYGDLNGDSRDDAAVLLTRSGGGSGIFVYVAVFVSGQNSYKGTNAIFIGDRINPSSISVSGSTIVVSYLDRGSDEPFAAEPTIAATKRFVIRSGELIEL